MSRRRHGLAGLKNIYIYIIYMCYEKDLEKTMSRRRHGLTGLKQGFAAVLLNYESHCHSTSTIYCHYREHFFRICDHLGVLVHWHRRPRLLVSPSENTFYREHIL